MVLHVEIELEVPALQALESAGEVMETSFSLMHWKNRPRVYRFYPRYWQMRST